MIESSRLNREDFVFMLFQVVKDRYSKNFILQQRIKPVVNYEQESISSNHFFLNAWIIRFSSNSNERYHQRTFRNRYYRQAASQ